MKCKVYITVVVIVAILPIFGCGNSAHLQDMERRRVAKAARKEVAERKYRDSGALEFKKGERSFFGEPQDAASAAKWWKKAKNMGYMRASERLRQTYEYNPVVMDKRFFGVLTFLAENEDAEAQYRMGEIHGFGAKRIGIRKDYSEAAKWYSRAAMNGHLRSQQELGSAYYRGRPGIKVNYDKARQWFTMAANQGGGTGLFFLAIMYCKGQGVEVDMAKAVNFYGKANNLGVAEAKEGLARDCKRNY